jgi:hypothetical protein
MRQFLKISPLLFIFVFSFACNTRQKQEFCSLSDVLTCAVSYSTQDEIEVCVAELTGNSCEVSEDDQAAIDANVSDIEDTTASTSSYTCATTDTTLEQIEDDGDDVRHTPYDGVNTFYVDPLHNPFDEFDDYNVTYTIQTAIDGAGPGDMIVICPGHYYENIVIDDDKDGLQIINIDNGSFGLAGYTTIEALTTSSVIEVNGAADLLIRGLTIQGGYNTYGGGISISVFRDDITFSDYIAIENSIIQDNTALLAGGGIFHEGYIDVRLKTVIVQRNTATSGGGISVSSNENESKTFYCQYCEITQNSALTAGSAIYFDGEDGVLIVDSYLQRNYNSYSDYTVAAIDIDGNGQFYSNNVEWGEGSGENVGGDIFNRSEYQDRIETYSLDELLGFEVDDIQYLTLTDIQNLDFSSIDSVEVEETWVYNLEGIESVECNLAESEAVCVIQ